MSKIFWICVSLVLVALAAGCSNLGESKTLPTYFDYTPEQVASLRALSSDFEMTVAEHDAWDGKIQNLALKGEELGDTRWTSLEIGEKSFLDLYPYLKMAQRDAAFLSFNAQGKFEGSMGPVTKGVICLFSEEECQQLSVEQSDEYSELLAGIVVAKIKERLDAIENMEPIVYPPKQGIAYYTGTEEKPYKGATFKVKPWFFDSMDLFRAPPPPVYGSDEDLKQLEITREVSADSDTNPEKVDEIKLWKHPDSAFDFWYDTAEMYLKEENAGLEKTLLVKSTLYALIRDALDLNSDSKETYLSKRPVMRFKEADPNDPIIDKLYPRDGASYPSSTLVDAHAAKIVLSYFFPAKESELQSFVDRQANARLWQGMHFQMDLDASLPLGTKIGNEAVKQLEAQKSS